MSIVLHGPLTIEERVRLREAAEENGRRLAKDRQSAAEARDLLRHALEQRGRQWTGKGRLMPGIDVAAIVPDADQYVSTNVLRTVARRSGAARAARANNRLPTMQIDKATSGNNPLKKPHTKGAGRRTHNRARKTA